MQDWTLRQHGAVRPAAPRAPSASAPRRAMRRRSPKSSASATATTARPLESDQTGGHFRPMADRARAGTRSAATTTRSWTGGSLEGLAGLEYNAGCWVFRGVLQRLQAATQTTSTGHLLPDRIQRPRQIGSDDIDRPAQAQRRRLRASPIRPIPRSSRRACGRACRSSRFSRRLRDENRDGIEGAVHRCAAAALRLCAQAQAQAQFQGQVPRPGQAAQEPGRPREAARVDAGRPHRRGRRQGGRHAVGARRAQGFRRAPAARARARRCPSARCSSARSSTG